MAELPALHPALVLLLGPLLLWVLPHRARAAGSLLLPVLSLLVFLRLDLGAAWSLTIGGLELQVLRLDALSRLFVLLFHLAAFLGALYALHVRDTLQNVMALSYAGAAIGAVLAGDLVTLFVFWELLAITSVFLIWASRTEQAVASGMRYLMMHVTSGLLLLAGAGLAWVESGSLALVSFVGESGTLVAGPAAWCLLFAFGIKAAFPGAHTWLVDGYPTATPTGAVFLTSFTTKVAVYALARMFAGFEGLILVGATMAMFPIFYAVIENDLRRVLGYSMINQIGFMVVGIGLGPGMGVNGAVAHAFNDVIFKGLLFMTMGAVLMRTGRINGSDLGGLYKTMPATAGFCMVGAASISAFPLFSGFVSKSMVMAEAAHQGHAWVWLALLFASAGVFHHAGIKIPFFAFFGHDSGLRPKEAPANMLAAMALAAALCVAIGCFPDALYALLPYEVSYEPYTTTHVVTQLQLLFFSALAFVSLMLTGIYPPELRSTNIDVDWLWRRAVPGSSRAGLAIARRVAETVTSFFQSLLSRGLAEVARLHSPAGRLGEPWPTGTTVFWAALLLGLYLVFSYRAIG